MNALPRTDGVPVVRTDFTDDTLWERLKEEITDDSGGYVAEVGFVEDRSLVGLDEDALVAAMPRLYPRSYEHPVVFIVDSGTVTTPDHPPLVIGVNERDDEPPFRALPREIGIIQANLSLANMDFCEYARRARQSGAYGRP